MIVEIDIWIEPESDRFLSDIIIMIKTPGHVLLTHWR